MSEPRANPTRLSRLPDGEAPHGINRLFRDARELADEDLPKLMWRIRASQRRRALRPRLVLRVAMVVGLIFAMGGFVGAYWGRRQSTVLPPPPAPAPATPKLRPAVRLAVPAAQPEEPPEPQPAAEKPKPARFHARTRVATVASPVIPTPGAAPAPSPIAVEQALIARAMKTLRDGQEAQAALTLLGEHARQFPNGVFRSEANQLRVEALLALGRKDEALSVLEHAPVASAPNRDDQLVLRGELRSTNGRWLEAKEDFDRVIRRHGDLLADSPKTRGLQDRALWGRAAARSRLGDEAGARADLSLYLRLFPDGRFAEHAARLLKSAP